LIPKYEFNIYSGWSTDNDGNRSHDYTVIANSRDEVERWINVHYDINEKAQYDASDELNLFIMYDGIYTVSDHGNLIEIDYNDEYLDKNGEIKEPYFSQTDYIEINGETLTEENYKFLKSGKHWTTVIDLTE